MRIKSTSYYLYLRIVLSEKILPSDDLLRGPVQELDLGSDEDDEPEIPLPRLKGRKSKQLERPLKIIPTASDISSDDEDEDEPITMANMAARSRALDEKAAREAQLDLEEMQDAALAGENEDEDDFDGEDDDEEGEGGEEGGFQLPSAAEIEEEKKIGGPQVHVVQRRMRECVRILGNFKKLGVKGR